MAFQFKQAPENSSVYSASKEQTCLVLEQQMDLQVFCAKVGWELVTFSAGKGNVEGKKKPQERTC